MKATIALRMGFIKGLLCLILFCLRIIYFHINNRWENGVSRLFYIYSWKRRN